MSVICCNLDQHFDAHQVNEADPSQIEDQGVEGHRLGLQGDRRWTRRLRVRISLAELDVAAVEVDVAGGRFRFVKVIL